MYKELNYHDFTWRWVQEQTQMLFIVGETTNGAHQMWINDSSK